MFLSVGIPYGRMPFQIKATTLSTAFSIEPLLGRPDYEKRNLL